MMQSSSSLSGRLNASFRQLLSLSGFFGTAQPSIAPFASGLNSYLPNLPQSTFTKPSSISQLAWAWNLGQKNLPAGRKQISKVPPFQEMSHHPIMSVYSTAISSSGGGERGRGQARLEHGRT